MSPLVPLLASSPPCSQPGLPRVTPLPPCPVPQGPWPHEVPIRVLVPRAPRVPGGMGTCPMPCVSCLLHVNAALMGVLQPGDPVAVAREGSWLAAGLSPHATPSSQWPQSAHSSPAAG